jgi:hypothetical protein
MSFDRIREREAELERKDQDRRLTEAAKDAIAAQNPVLDTINKMVEVMTADRQQSQNAMLQAQLDAMKAQYELQAKGNADAVRRSLQPSNDTHPAISAYSYPEGNVLRPKPKLTRESYWVGHRISEDELNPLEIELLNQVKAGRYHGGKWLVKENTDDTGTTRRVEVWFPTKDIDHRMEVPHSADPVMTGMALMLQEMVSGQAPVASLGPLHARIQELEAQLAVKQDMAALGR